MVRQKTGPPTEEAKGMFEYDSYYITICLTSESQYCSTCCCRPRKHMVKGLDANVKSLVVRGLSEISCIF